MVDLVFGIEASTTVRFWPGAVGSASRPLKAGFAGFSNLDDIVSALMAGQVCSNGFEGLVLGIRVGQIANGVFEGRLFGFLLAVDFLTVTTRQLISLDGI